MLTPIPFDGDIAVLGTNFGGERTPGWVYNLEADLSAAVAFGDESIPVVARRADPDEAEEIFESADHIYAGYADYRERAGTRDISAFVLTSPD